LCRAYERERERERGACTRPGPELKKRKRDIETERERKREREKKKKRERERERERERVSIRAKFNFNYGGGIIQIVARGHCNYAEGEKVRLTLGSITKKMTQECSSGGNDNYDDDTTNLDKIDTANI
jgi:hypothetical protein